MENPSVVGLRQVTHQPISQLIDFLPAKEANALLELYDKTGVKVGKLRPCSRPEWVVYDPVARAFSKNNGQVTYEGIGKINASPPRNIGEFEFHDPRSLVDYLAMPKRIQNIEELLAKYINRSQK